MTARFVGLTAFGAASLHQCLFPEDHLKRFFLSDNAAKDSKSTGAAVEVMRWLGFSNLSVTALLALLTSDASTDTNTLATALGALCIFDVAFVKRKYLESDLVNPAIPNIAEVGIAVTGVALLGFAQRF